MKKSELGAFWIGLLMTAVLSFLLYRFLRSRTEITPRPLIVTRKEQTGTVIIPSSAVEKDSLVQIHGIGPATEAKLNEAGIVSYHQLAALSPEDLLPYTGSRWIPEDWIRQAEELSEA